MTDPEILEIHIEVVDKRFVINVAVKTAEAKYRAYFAMKDTISFYSINCVVNEGQEHLEEIANAMFPNLCLDNGYDSSSVIESL
jgi:hypothetical protein